MTKLLVGQIVGLACIAAVLSACARERVVWAPPPPEDLRAVIEVKPKPPVSILTDSTASDSYNAEVEEWGERLRAAGMRLCLFYSAQGSPVDCTK
jgi:hypothetical protein